MAHLLRLTDGTTTVTFTTSPHSLKAYVPKVMSPDDRAGKPIGDWQVTEPCVVMIGGASTDALRTTLRQIETLLWQAADYQATRRGARVYVEFDPGSSGTVYRSEILNGILDEDEKALGIPWACLFIECQITWVRRGYWEASTETELPLLNGSIGGKQTGGVTILNHDDGDSGHDNWVAIDDTDVSGVVPAAVRLEITDSYASDQTFTLYLGHSAYLNFTNFLHVLEGESGTAGAGVTSTPTADANCSGAAYTALSWAGSLEVTLLKWALTAAQIQACAGRWFRVLARFKTLPAADLTTRLAMSLPSALPLLSVSGERVLSTSDYLQDLGSLRLPPWLPGESSCGASDFKLLATKSGGGTLDLDYLALLPADSVRCLRAAGSTGAVNTDKIVDDGMLGLSYLQAAGGTKTGQLSTYGGPILLVPGRDQRIYVLAANQNGGSEIARTHSVRAYYRPRRLTL